MTIRVYYLETETIDGTDRMIGESIITNALVQSEDNLRKVMGGAPRVIRRNLRGAAA